VIFVSDICNEVGDQVEEEWFTHVAREMNQQYKWLWTGQPTQVECALWSRAIYQALLRKLGKWQMQVESSTAGLSTQKTNDYGATTGQAGTSTALYHTVPKHHAIICSIG